MDLNDEMVEMMKFYEFYKKIKASEEKDKLTNKNNGATGFIIKYGSNGEVEWAQIVGGLGNDHISLIAETGEGNYIIGGYFNSSIIDLNNGKILKNNG